MAQQSSRAALQTNPQTHAQALRELLERRLAVVEAATPGPWKTDHHYVVAEVATGRPGGEVMVDCRCTNTRCNPTTPHLANAAFIADSGTHRPAELRLQLTLVEEMAGMLLTDDAWWCQYCLAWIDPAQVTYSETHTECGFPVGAHPAHTFAARLLALMHGKLCGVEG